MPQVSPGYILISRVHLVPTAGLIPPTPSSSLAPGPEPRIPGLRRVSPEESTQPSSAHSRTPASRQRSMVSATRPARRVPTLAAAHPAACARLLGALQPPRAPLLRFPGALFWPASTTRQLLPQAILAAAPTPCWPQHPSLGARSEPPPLLLLPLLLLLSRLRRSRQECPPQRAATLSRTCTKSGGQGQFITFSQPTSYPGTSFQ